MTRKIDRIEIELNPHIGAGLTDLGPSPEDVMEYLEMKIQQVVYYKNGEYESHDIVDVRVVNHPTAPFEMNHWHYENFSGSEEVNILMLEAEEVLHSHIEAFVADTLQD